MKILLGFTLLTFLAVNCLASDMKPEWHGQQFRFTLRNLSQATLIAGPVDVDPKHVPGTFFVEGFELAPKQQLPFTLYAKPTEEPRSMLHIGIFHHNAEVCQISFVYAYDRGSLWVHDSNQDDALWVSTKSSTYHCYSSGIDFQQGSVTVFVSDH